MSNSGYLVRQLLREQLAASVPSTGTSSGASGIIDEFPFDNIDQPALNAKLLALFDLPRSSADTDTTASADLEEFKMVERCWLVRNVMLKGFLFMSSQHVCFYAPIPKDAPVHKEGFLLVKTARSQSSKLPSIMTTSTYQQQYVVLKDHVLEWYDSPDTTYYPAGSIHLKQVHSIQLVHGLNRAGFQFKLRLLDKSRKYCFQCDTQQSCDEWVRLLETSIFRARNVGDQVKIVLPFSSLAAIESLQSGIFEDALSLRVRQPVSSSTTSSTEEEVYIFTGFAQSDSIIEQLKQAWNRAKSTPLSISTTSTTAQPHQQHSASAKDTSLLGTATAANSLPKLKSMSEVCRHFPTLYDTEGDIDARNVQVLASAQAYLVNTFPNLGRVYITTRHLLFRSSIVGLKTRFVVPLDEVAMVQRIGQGFLCGLYCGLKNGEVWFEFKSTEGRERCLGVIEGILAERKLRNSHSLDSSSGEETETEYETEYEDDALLLSDLENGDNETDHDQPDELSLKQDKKSTSPPMIKQLCDRLTHIRDTSISMVLDEIHRLDASFVPRLSEDALLEVPPVANRPAAAIELVPMKRLKFCCMTIGTRGDVQPFIALSKGLMQHGHSVVLGTHLEYKEWVESHGIEFRPISGDPALLMQLCVNNGMFSISFIREATSKFRTWIDELLLSAWEAAQGAEVLIDTPVTMAGYHIAEKLHIPYFSVFPMPWTRTRDFPHPFAVSEMPLGPGYNIMTWMLIENILWKGIQPQINRFRKRTLDLPPLSSGAWLEEKQVPFLYSFSEHVVRAPSDWRGWIKECGYWFLDAPDAGWTPPEDLVKFLDRESGDSRPIVYIGFGSIIVSDPEQLTRSIVEAIRRAGVKAVVSKGWSARSHEGESWRPEKKSPTKLTSTSDIYYMSSVPHDWLFPQLDAVVHHGGAGTTAAGLRAGKPTVIKPFFGDQYFWASRTVHLGVGVQLKKLDVDSLAESLRRVTKDEKMCNKAKLVGEKIRSENGVETAISAIHHHLPYLRRQLEEEQSSHPSPVDFTKRLSLQPIPSSTLENVETQSEYLRGYLSDDSDLMPKKSRWRLRLSGSVNGAHSTGPSHAPSRIHLEVPALSDKLDDDDLSPKTDLSSPAQPIHSSPQKTRWQRLRKQASKSLSNIKFSFNSSTPSATSQVVPQSTPAIPTTTKQHILATDLSSPSLETVSKSVRSASANPVAKSSMRNLLSYQRHRHHASDASFTLRNSKQ